LRQWRRAIDDGAMVDACRQQAERAGGLVAEPRRAKGIGNGCRRLVR
jgi:hypothetical protein